MDLSLDPGDELTLDTETCQLLRPTGEVSLRPRAFQLLTLLVENHGKAISRDALRKHLSGEDTAGGEPVERLVVDLRHALGDDARAPVFIRTVRGKGYHFCGEVVALDASGPDGAAVGSLVGKQGQFLLKEGQNILGRGPHSHVLLDSDTVSRRHAAVSITGRRATLRDLGSRNGTFVGKNRVLAAPIELSDGDTIRVGSVRLELRMPNRFVSTSTRSQLS
jgi:DNA-binding winged helix-turn-helix (wHTH) protein